MCARARVHSIEAAEYDVLPRLLVTGALCRVDFLLLEWHLNALKPGRRFAGFALRHTIDSLLRAGCSAPPQRVFHDEYFTTNFGYAHTRCPHCNARAASSPFDPVRPQPQRPCWRAAGTCPGWGKQRVDTAAPKIAAGIRARRTAWPR